MDVRPVSRSPSIADLKRQPTMSSRLSLGLAAQIPKFQRSRSRSTIEVERAQSPKVIVPMRAAHSAHGSNNSSSRRGRNSQHSRNSQSRKAHPSESRYSNRSFRDKSMRHDVEVEDLNSEAPPPILLRQDSSVYPSAVARHANTPPPPVLPQDEPSANETSDPSRTVPGSRIVTAASSSSSSSLVSHSYISTSVHRILCTTKALLFAGLGSLYVISAAMHRIFPELGRVAKLRAQLLGNAEDSGAPANQYVYLVSSILFASAHFGFLLRMGFRAVALKRIRVAPVVQAPMATANSSDQVQPFGSDRQINSDGVNSGEGSPKKVMMRPPSRFCSQRTLATLSMLSLASYQQLLSSESSAAFEFEYLKHRVLQLTLHTCLASHLSGGVSSLSLNQVYVAAIVLSCWIPVLLLVRSRSSDSRSALRRRCCLCASFTLDVVAVVLIPTGLSSPYLHAHNAQEQSSPVPQQHSDVWIVNMLLDSQFLDSVSFTLLSICFGVNIVAWLHISLLEAASSVSNRIMPSSPATQIGSHPGRAQSHSSTVSVSGQRFQVTNYLAQRSKATTTLQQLLQRTRLSLATLVLLAWGLSVLACHLVAISRSQMQPPGCLIRTFPWYRLQPSCALLEISCVPGSYGEVLHKAYPSQVACFE